MAAPVKHKSTADSRVLKAMGIFGGVRIIQILCSIVRTKLVAILIGPAGVGLITLYNNTIDFLSQTTQLNLRQSAVRDIAAAASHPQQAATIASVVRRLSLFTGIAGTVIVLALAPLLSRWTFGDTSHTLAFILLSPMMLLLSAASGEWAVMQGFDKLEALAKSTLYASVAATVIAVPLFIFFRIAGIVPVLISFAVSNCFFAIYFRVKTPHTKLSFKAVTRQGREMLALGLYMTLGSGITLLASYVFSAYLNRTSDASAVGIYQAGFTLVNTYVGMVFAAIATEFYPRLSAVAKSRMRSGTIVSHEMKMVLLVLLPMAPAMIAAKELIINMLYSSGFRDALPYVSIAMVGVPLRGISFCMAYAMLARGDGRIYVLTEAFSAAVYLALNIWGYEQGGYAGLGLAYIGWYGAYTAVVYAVYRFRYGLTTGRGIMALSLACTGVAAAACVTDLLWGALIPALIAVAALVPTAKKLL